MKEALLLQANYNQFANANMFATLLKQNKNVIYDNCGLHNGSIAKTIEHLICGEIGIFIKSFSPWASKAPSEMDSILSALTPSFTLESSILENLESMRALCAKADKIIIEIIQNTADFSTIETLSFPGVTFQKSRAFLALAMLNHSTHHRGQIAGALDILKIENDFNGMLGMS